MKSSKKVLVILSAALTAGALFLVTRRLNRKSRLIRIADEGYETANDILFPSKTDRHRVHYGPVLPE